MQESAAQGSNAAREPRQDQGGGPRSLWWVVSRQPFSGFWQRRPSSWRHLSLHSLPPTDPHHPLVPPVPRALHPDPLQRRRSYASRREFQEGDGCYRGSRAPSAAHPHAHLQYERPPRGPRAGHECGLPPRHPRGHRPLTSYHHVPEAPVKSK